MCSCGQHEGKKLKSKTSFGEVNQQHGSLMSALSECERGKGKKGRGKNGSDCRVGHVCDVLRLTSWLHQQVVCVGSSGRPVKQPCHT